MIKEIDIYIHGSKVELCIPKCQLPAALRHRKLARKGSGAAGRFSCVTQTNHPEPEN